MTMTKLANIIDPEVFSDLISAGLPKAIRFSPLATVNQELVGQPGSTLNFPAWTYIGPAADVAEGEPIPLDAMAQTQKGVSVKKAAKGVEITDEAILSGLGDPIGEANRQLLMSIADKVDNDLIAAAQEATQTTPDLTTVDGLTVGINVLGLEDPASSALLLNPTDASKLLAEARKEGAGSDVMANQLINGANFTVLGVNIVTSNKIDAGAGLLIADGALALVMKRNAQVEAERDIIKKTTVITADEHYAAYLYDATKVVKQSV